LGGLVVYFAGNFFAEVFPDWLAFDAIFRSAGKLQSAAACPSEVGTGSRGENAPRQKDAAAL
jgi:hypothetical protein